MRDAMAGCDSVRFVRMDERQEQIRLLRKELGAVRVHRVEQFGGGAAFLGFADHDPDHVRLGQLPPRNFGHPHANRGQLDRTGAWFGVGRDGFGVVDRAPRAAR